MKAKRQKSKKPSPAIKSGKRRERTLKRCEKAIVLVKQLIGDSLFDDDISVDLQTALSALKEHMVKLKKRRRSFTNPDRIEPL